MRMRNQDIYSDDLDEESFNAAGWFGSPELLQTSDLNQPPLETFLRTGTKLSMIIQLNHH